MTSVVFQHLAVFCSLFPHLTYFLSSLLLESLLFLEISTVFEEFCIHLWMLILSYEMIPWHPFPLSQGRGTGVGSENEALKSTLHSYETRG